MATAPHSRALLALALVLLAPCVAGAELGTLFHTPEERQRLDRLRRGEPEVSHVARSGVPLVTGYVRRSDGRHTIWIDGTPVTVGPREAAAILESQAKSPRLQGSDEVRVERKPGR